MKTQGWLLLHILRPLAPYIMTLYLLVSSAGTSVIVWVAIVVPHHEAIRSYWFYAGCFIWLMLLIIVGVIAIAIAIEEQIQQMRAVSDIHIALPLESASALALAAAAEAILQHRIGRLEAELARAEQREAERKR